MNSSTHLSKKKVPLKAHLVKISTAVALTLASCHSAYAFVHPGISMTQANLDALRARMKTATCSNIALNAASNNTLCPQIVPAGTRLTTSQNAVLKLLIPDVATQKAILDKIKTNYKADYTAYANDNIPLKYFSNVNYQPTPQSVVSVTGGKITYNSIYLHMDAVAAHAQALMWVMTGDDRYKTNALNILNGWAKKFQSIENIGGVTVQNQLVAGFVAPNFLNAAEIMRHYKKGAAGWSSANIATFNGMINKLQSYYKLSLSRPGNWGAAAAYATMAQGIFQDNQALYDLGKKNLLDKASINFFTSGEVLELKTRDCWHPQYTIHHWTRAGLADKIQGKNEIFNFKLPGDSGPILPKTFEYFGNAVYNPQSTVRNCSTALIEDGYADIGLNYYKQNGRNIPIFEKWITDTRAKNLPSPLFTGFDAVTHAD